MDFERIKRVKLLKTLKGTDDDGKQLVWLAGTEWKKKPYPRSIMQELGLNRPGMLEIEYEPESPPEKPVEVEEAKVVEETLDVTPDDKPEVKKPEKTRAKVKKAKAKPAAKKSAPRKSRRRKAKK